MAKVDVTVQCEQATLDFGTALASFVGATKQALANGWQPIEDIPAVVLAAMTDLIPALKNAAAIPGDLADDKVAFMNSCYLTGTKVLDAVTK